MTTELAASEARAPRAEDVPLLKSRAAELARAPAAERARATLHVLIFALGGERYAIQSSCVLQVTVLREMTALPGAALPLFAVTHWRGDVLTLLDLRDVLGARTTGLTDLGRIVVVDGRDRRFGIVVDAVVDMTELAADAVRPLPDDEQRRRSLLRGMTDDGVLIIDADALLERYGVVRGRHTDTGRGG